MKISLLCIVATAISAVAGEVCDQSDLTWRLRGVSDLQVQPGGNLVVYVEARNNQMDDRTYSNLWLIALDGSGARALTRGKQRASGPAWAPDGKKLAYVSDRDGRPRIYVIQIRTGAETSIDVGDRAPSSIAWSSDGGRIAYLAFVPTRPRWDPPMPVAPAGAKWAAPAVAVSNLRWTFDGTGLLQPGGARIHVVPAAGVVSHQITREPYEHTSYLAEPEFQWSAMEPLYTLQRLRTWMAGPYIQETKSMRFPLTAAPSPSHSPLKSGTRRSYASRRTVHASPTQDSPGKGKPIM